MQECIQSHWIYETIVPKNIIHCALLLRIYYLVFIFKLLTTLYSSALVLKHFNNSIESQNCYCEAEGWSSLLRIHSFTFIAEVLHLSSSPVANTASPLFLLACVHYVLS